MDLNCRLTPTASSFALFNFLMGGRFDAATNEYLVMPAHSASELRGGAEPEAGAAVAAAADTARTTSTQRLLSTSRPTSRSGTVDAPLRPGGLEPRHYVMHSFLYHPGLAALQYGAFFNMCRLQGVSFDLRLRRGTAFVLMDSLASGEGAHCCARLRRAALQAHARAAPRHAARGTQARWACCLWEARASKR